MKFDHIGWCKEGVHDKVWGIIRLDGDNCVTFWGRRGSKLQTKMIKASWWEAGDLFRKKCNKGYREIQENELDQVYPEFKTDLEKTAIWAMLKL
jgi:predicted DNA-binding WGR domain protein